MEINQGKSSQVSTSSIIEIGVLVVAIIVQIVAFKTSYLWLSMVSIFLLLSILIYDLRTRDSDKIEVNKNETV